ncbi:MAG: DNA-directed RNA polymerase subunit alpha [SAR202 cluster bacterium]|nr:DNA-directed RNA polymerase subunit alpha [SAR202 cluster bacterium]
MTLEPFAPAGIVEFVEEEEVPIPNPDVSEIEADEQYGKFEISPLQKGFGITLGNPIRRVLYSSLPGVAITSVKIDDVYHEYSTIEDVKEEVPEILLNIKGIRILNESDTDRPGKMRLEVSGEGEVCAGDIMPTSDFQIVNPELHLATLNSSKAKLSLEMNVDHGTGYKPASAMDESDIGLLPVDAIFTPIRKVNYSVEPTRIGQNTNLEKLIVEVWTDGSISPKDAIADASKILSEQFYFISTTTQIVDTEDESLAPNLVPHATANIKVEDLELSSRTLNCLKRADINTVGGIMQTNKKALMQIRNFGEKSYRELVSILLELGLDHKSGGPSKDPETLEETEITTE